MNVLVVGVRFQAGGKIYHFDATPFRDRIRLGDRVIVETHRGPQVVEVVQVLENPEPPKNGEWKPVLRLATPRDLLLRQYWEQKETEAVVNCQAKVRAARLSGVKVVAAEFNLSGDQLTFLYTYEGDGKLNLSPVRKAMGDLYNAEVTMRKIGPRDAARIMGGMGACGLETRCCSLYMGESCSITIKMAKAQNVSLASSEITGMCGRLRCCLRHEYPIYEELLKGLPKVKKRVVTPMGEGKVIKVNALKGTVLVKLEESIKEFHRDEVRLP
ncbi:MAG: stage 0 sporulation protein [Anaerolineae bacterium]|nr:MAG: stage 0 sporulation protein [Anaerolineae bacterium]